MKKILSILTVIAIIFSIQSQSVFAIETEKTAFILESQSTTVDYNHALDIYTVSVFSVYSSPVTKASGYQYKGATHSKYFYIVSSGEKVAEYTLTANFRYDKNAEKAECRSTSTTGNSLVNGWKISRTSCVDNISSSLGAGRGDYSLYQNGTLNNTDSIYIYCDHKGNITKS